MGCGTRATTIPTLLYRLTYADNALAEAHDAGNVGADRKVTPPPAIGADNGWRSDLNETQASAYRALGLCLVQDAPSVAEGARKFLPL